jgi:hypothetical protein
MVKSDSQFGCLTFFFAAAKLTDIAPGHWPEKSCLETILAATDQLSPGLRAT